MTKPLLILVFTAAMALGAQIEVPLGPVPFVLSDFFVLLAGLLLGPRWGPLSVLLYLLMGAMGMHVFAGGGRGMEHLFGPTGGFLFGFVAAAFIAGVISHPGPFQLLRDFAATITAQATFFIFGIIWLKYATGMDWTTTLEKGFLPFLFPILFKFISATLIAHFSRKLLPSP